jgi:hypothetical protein
MVAHATQQRMLEALKQERALNEDLQRGVPEAVPPDWPSLTEQAIDDIAPIGFSTRNILGNESGIRTQDFRLTGGDIVVEIVLERCLYNLIAATLATKPTTIAFTPGEIGRMELNCRDGLFDHMPPLEALYREEVSVENQRLLALGEFVGDCLVRTFGAVWQYAHPPQRSTLFLGNEALDPFGQVAKWMADPEQTHFEELIFRARQALLKSSAMPNHIDVIDPTPGLEGSALTTMLAELWTAYRFSLAETAYTELASTIEVVHQTAQTVLFTIDKSWVPAFGLGREQSAVNREDKVSMAYVRGSGQFLLLGSPKHFGKFAGLSVGALNQQTQASLIALVQNHFCPRWQVISTPTLAQQARQRLNSQEIAEPTLRGSGHGQILDLWAVAGRRAVRMTLQHTPEQPTPWQFTVR